MDYVIKFLYEFILLFLLFYIIQNVFIDKKKRNPARLKKNDEINLFIRRYKLDIKKTEYKRIRKTVYFINSFILAFTTAFILNIKNVYIQFIVCFAIVFALMYSLFEIFGKKLKREEENI